jgi:hypothetical protein
LLTWLQAAGLLLAEVFMVGAAAAGSEVPDVPALKRLLFDVFHEDIDLFKEYCMQVSAQRTVQGALCTRYVFRVLPLFCVDA